MRPFTSASSNSLVQKTDYGVTSADSTAGRWKGSTSIAGGKFRKTDGQPCWSELNAQTGERRITAAAGSWGRAVSLCLLRPKRQNHTIAYTWLHLSCWYRGKRNGQAATLRRSNAMAWFNDHHGRNDKHRVVQWKADNCIIHNFGRTFLWKLRPILQCSAWVQSDAFGVLYRSGCYHTLFGP